MIDPDDPIPFSLTPEAWAAIQIQEGAAAAEPQPRNCPYPCRPTHREPIAYSQVGPNLWQIYHIIEVSEDGLDCISTIVESILFDEFHPLFCKTDRQHQQVHERSKWWFGRLLQTKLQNVLLEAFKCGGRWWK